MAVGRKSLNNILNEVHNKSYKITCYGIIILLVSTIGTFPISASPFSFQIALAVGETTGEIGLQLSNIGRSSIDLVYDESQRELRIWAEFFGFRINDGYFDVKISEVDSGATIFETEVLVGSTIKERGDFESAVYYIITDRALLQDGIKTGNYEMVISTLDQSVVEKIPFSIIDSAAQYQESEDTPREDPPVSQIEIDMSTENQFSKKISLANNADPNSNVITCSDIPEDYVEMGIEFNLYKEIFDEELDVTDDADYHVEYNDSDGDGIDDQICWMVPAESSTFMIIADLTVLNVQSYPMVGGNWIVEFETVGTADLKNFCS